MKPTRFPLFTSFLFPPIILLFLLTSSLSTDYHYPQNCQPKSCGGLANVTFPFWIRGLQPDYCGYPPFELRCEDDGLKLFMADEDYRVLDISYENQTSTVSISNFSSMDSSCLLPYNNLSFALTPFAISSLNRELVIVHNCSAKMNGAVEISCHDQRNYAYLGGQYRYQNPESKGTLGSCFSTVVPVWSSNGVADAGKYQALLGGGFLLNWTAPECWECRGSGGQCGYNNNTGGFMCICHDRAHWKSCSERNNSKAAVIIGLSTAAGGLSLVIFCSLCFVLHRRWRKKQCCFGRSSSFVLSNGTHGLGSSFSSPIFTYDELYEATNGFDGSKELGDGGFGTVYKGKLRDGRVVAVKRLYEHNLRRLEQFMNEVKILSLLRHQNLVTLYGCTSRRSRELLLVYEFVPNGTVADHLHGPRASQSPLPWRVRMTIAIETADALNYLHSVEPQIIHRDVKTTNILLDGSYHVKVADFGLSRLFPLDATHVSTSPQGTPGYVDPAYHQSYQLTDKSDVYSFGVVLMELISSKPAVDFNRERNEVNLSNLALRMIQSKGLHEFVDPNLGYESDYRTKTMVTEVAGLGLQCLQSERELRPGIKEVADVLRKIEKHGFKEEDQADLDGAVVQEATLLTKVSPCSPNSVNERWLSMSSSISSFNG